MTLNKKIISLFIIVGLVLMIPLVAMQFSDDVNWTVLDFLLAGILLLSLGLLLEFVSRRINKKQHRIILLSIIIILFLLVWVEIAVGIFGTPIAGS